MSRYDCWCDGEAPSVSHLRRLKARKEHRCTECACTIRIGKTYERVWGIWDREAMTIRTCGHCVALRDYTAAHVPCFCWVYGQMREAALSTLAEYADAAPGLWFGGARLYLGARRARRAGQQLGRAGPHP